MNNMYLIIGEDKQQIDFYLTEILNNIKHTEDNKITYDLNQSSIADILDEASMISLFANTKVIVGTNLDISKISDNDLEYLEKYVKDINKDVYIILLTNKVDARLKTYKVFKDNFKIIDTIKTDNQDELLIYVNKLIKEKNYSIDKINLDYFLSKAGKDINNINSELNKLFIYKEEDKTITKEDIDLLITDNIDNVIYEFTNAVLENNQEIITKMYNNFIIEGISIDYLLVSLSNVFRQALIIKELKDEGKSSFDIAKIINKKEFYVKKMLERLYGHTKNDLCHYINKLAEIDKRNKQGKSNIDELAIFLLDMNR